MDKLVKKTIEAYDKNAKTYFNSTFNKISQYHLITFISYLKGKKILDVGSGSGRDVNYFKEEGYSVVGIDLSSELIKEAKRNIKGNIKLMDMEKIEYKDKTFDGIWCCASLLHVPRKKVPKVLKEFKRVLKPNGIIYISVKEGVGEKLAPSKKLNESPVLTVYYSQIEFEKILRENEFKILKYDTETIDETTWINAYVKLIDN